jgi:uncharacterized protein (TIGR03084 family)
VSAATDTRTEALAAVARDLAAEQHALDDLVASAPRASWDLLTPAVGWDVRDQVAHIALVEEYACASVTDPDAFARVVGDSVADGPGFERALYERGRTHEPAELLATWRSARTRLLDAVADLAPDARISWFGPSMSPRSFLTARLMETWSHGTDVRDALGVPTGATPSLRHVAHLGVSTRGWSFVVRGLEPDQTPVQVVLTGPDDATWTWGDADAADVVRGTALDFALVATQRRHWRDTDLDVTGASAQRWLDVAQAFAGPPTLAARGRATHAPTHAPAHAPMKDGEVHP